MFHILGGELPIYGFPDGGDVLTLMEELVGPYSLFLADIAADSMVIHITGEEAFMPKILLTPAITIKAIYDLRYLLGYLITPGSLPCKVGWRDGRSSLSTSQDRDITIGGTT